MILEIWSELHVEARLHAAHRSHGSRQYTGAVGSDCLCKIGFSETAWTMMAFLSYQLDSPTRSTDTRTLYP